MNRSDPKKAVLLAYWLDGVFNILRDIWEIPWEAKLFAVFMLVWMCAGVASNLRAHDAYMKASKDWREMSAACHVRDTLKPTGTR